MCCVVVTEERISEGRGARGGERGEGREGGRKGRMDTERRLFIGRKEKGSDAHG